MNTFVRLWIVQNGKCDVRVSNVRKKGPVFFVLYDFLFFVWISRAYRLACIQNGSSRDYAVTLAIDKCQIVPNWTEKVYMFLVQHLHILHICYSYSV